MNTLRSAIVGFVICSICAIGAFGQAPVAPTVTPADINTETSPELISIDNVSVATVMKLLSTRPYYKYLAADEKSSFIMVTGSRGQIDQIKAEIALIDTPRVLISFEAMVIDTSDDNLEDKGVDWSWSPGDKDPKGVQTIKFFNTVLGYTNTRNGNILANIYNFVGKDTVKILAKPKFTIQDREEGMISIGTDNYVVTYISGLGATPSNPLAVKSGITITARAMVMKDGRIMVDADIVVSETIGTGSTGLPVVSTRKLTTKLPLKSGETMIAGGLTSSQNTHYKSGIPILKDLPLIGGLFSQSRTQKKGKEVTILLTPIIIKPDLIAPAVEKAKEVAVERAPGPSVSVVESPGSGKQADQNVSDQTKVSEKLDIE